MKNITVYPIWYKDIGVRGSTGLAKRGDTDATRSLYFSIGECGGSVGECSVV